MGAPPRVWNLWMVLEGEAKHLAEVRPRGHEGGGRRPGGTVAVGRAVRC